MPAPIKISDIDGRLLPRTLTGPIFTKATEQSAVQRLARRVPMALDASTSIPVPLDVPVADWVDETGRKPVTSSGVAVKTMTGKKVAALIPVSEEVARTNAAGLYQQLQRDLPTALARAFDFSVIHGKTMRGGQGPWRDFLASTPHSITLGSTPKNQGGLYADFVKGMEVVVDENYDFSGFVADQRLLPKLLLATDTSGHPIFVNTQTEGINAAGAGTLIGETLTYSRGVSGKVHRQSGATDTGLRAIGGDWSQCAYGVGMDITIRVSTEATYIDDEGIVHSAFQENLVLLLAEAVYGWVCNDTSAFVTYVGRGRGSA